MKKGWLYLVTISNNALTDNELDDRVKSRMGSSEIFFEPYDMDDVMDILYDKSSLAFSKPVDLEVLIHCAKLSSFDHGDARRALELLRIAGENCKDKITKQDVDNAAKQIQYDRIETILENASYHLRTVVCALCSLHVLTKNTMHATSSIYKRYTHTMMDGIAPLSYRRITDLLIELKNSGLVDSQTISKGRHGYGTQYRLRFAPEMIGPLLSEEWWQRLLESKKILEQKPSKPNIPCHNNLVTRQTRRLNVTISKKIDKVWKEQMGL